MITLYGIKNCDTVRKARQWLEDKGVEYRFHDFRSNGLEPALLERFEAALGWENLLNTRGPTWRKLDEDRRADLDRDKSLALMLEKPTLIKRPVLETGNTTLIGFSPEAYAREL